MLKIGLIGSFLSLVRCKSEIERNADLKIEGIYDPSAENLEINLRSGLKNYSSVGKLLDDTDMICLSEPNNSYEIITAAVKKSKHILLHLPLLFCKDDIKTIAKLTREAGVKVSIGLNEYYYPVFEIARRLVNKPAFINTKYTGNNIDLFCQSDLLGNLAYDIMIILTIVKCDIKKIAVHDVTGIKDTPDLINARIEFNNGCVADVTSDRLSPDHSHDFLFYMKESLIKFDLINKKYFLTKVNNINGEKINMQLLNKIPNYQEQLSFEDTDLSAGQILRKEIESFIYSITEDTPMKISIEDYFKTCEVIQTITERIKN